VLSRCCSSERRPRLAGWFESRRAHSQPLGYAETAWLRGTFVWLRSPRRAGQVGAAAPGELAVVEAQQHLRSWVALSAGMPRSLMAMRSGMRSSRGPVVGHPRPRRGTSDSHKGRRFSPERRRRLIRERVSPPRNAMAASTSSGTLPPQFGAVSERATADTRPHAGNGSAEPCSPTTATFARLKGRAAQATQRPSITWCRALRRHTCSGSPRTSSPPARAATTATAAASQPRTHGRRSSACAPRRSAGAADRTVGRQTRSLRRPAREASCAGDLLET
jgi:hypothetical protein